MGRPVPAGARHPQTALVAIDGFDSMAQIEVLLLRSDVYGVQLQESEVRPLERISDVERYVHVERATDAG